MGLALLLRLLVAEVHTTVVHVRLGCFSEKHVLFACSVLLPFGTAVQIEDQNCLLFVLPRPLLHFVFTSTNAVGFRSLSPFLLSLSSLSTTLHTPLASVLRAIRAIFIYVVRTYSHVPEMRRT